MRNKTLLLGAALTTLAFSTSSFAHDDFARGALIGLGVGAVIGATANGGGVVYGPPVAYAPPVVYAPPPAYVVAPTVVYPAPRVYVAPRVGYYGGYYGRGDRGWRGHGWHHRRWRDDDDD